MEEGRHTEPLRIVENAVLVAFVLVVIVTDWRWQRIPNLVTFPTMGIGLVLGAIEGLPGELLQSGLLDHAAGLAIGLAVSYPFYVGGGIKAGDAKMLMAIGAVRGSIFLLNAALYGALAGGVLALVLMITRRLTPPEVAPRNRLEAVLKARIPYGVALGIGALIALWVLP